MRSVYCDAINAISTSYRAPIQAYYEEHRLPADDVVLAVITGDIERAITEAPDANELKPVLRFLHDHADYAYGSRKVVELWVAVP